MSMRPPTTRVKIQMLKVASTITTVQRKKPTARCRAASSPVPMCSAQYMPEAAKVSTVSTALMMKTIFIARSQQHGQSLEDQYAEEASSRYHGPLQHYHAAQTPHRCLGRHVHREAQQAGQQQQAEHQTENQHACVPPFTRPAPARQSLTAPAQRRRR